MKSAIRRHGWFLILFVAWLALAQVKRAPGLNPTLIPGTSPAQNQLAVARVSETPTHTPPAASATPSSSPTASATPSPSPTASATQTPSSTATSHATPEPAANATLQPAETPLLNEPSAPATLANNPVHPQVQPLVLANYYPWYDPATWSSGCTSAADRPLAGPYNSDDIAVITRHLGEAQQAGLDGFAVHWYVRGDRTDRNLVQVLNNSPANFDSTVIFLCHIVGCAGRQDVIDQLAYIITTHGAHSHFFRINGKPVIMFSDMGRVPGAGGSQAAAIDIWGHIRASVDPDHTTWWIAEGLEPAYLQVFDGLYIYKIDHACCPNAAAKAPTWAGWVWEWEQQTGQAKLWVGTVMPGWNDVNSVSPACTGPDSRQGVVPFARDRENGAYYDRTWEAVLPTQPDFILLDSFNEWIEGSYIEPSTSFGDVYLQLTRAGVTRFKTSR